MGEVQSDLVQCLSRLLSFGAFCLLTYSTNKLVLKHVGHELKFDIYLTVHHII